MATSNVGSSKSIIKEDAEPKAVKNKVGQLDVHVSELSIRVGSFSSTGEQVCYSGVMMSCRTPLLLPLVLPPPATPRQGTLEFALRPYRIPAEVLREKHEAVLGMITIFLGELEFAGSREAWETGSRDLIT